MPRRRRPPLKTLARMTARLDGREVDYTLKESRAARQTRLEITPTAGLTVVVPRGCDLTKVQSLLEARGRWITEKLDAVERARAAAEDRRSAMRRLHLGREMRVEISPCWPGQERVVRSDGTIQVFLALTDAAAAAERLSGWQRAQAEKLLPEVAGRISRQFGLKYTGLRVRGQRTRWGSCSTAGALSLNWKLVMAPEMVIEYVVVHELAHREQMNHSGAFWKLVAARCPEWKECRRWLVEHAYELLEDGAAVPGS